MIRHFHFLALACLLFAAGGPEGESNKDDAAAKDLTSLQGKWKCVEEDSNGKVDKGFRNGHVIGFEKHEMIAYDAEGGVHGRASIKLNPLKTPKQIDQTIIFDRLFPNAKGRTFLGIYRLDGNELKIALAIAPWGHERPREFSTREGSHYVVFTYKRVKQ